METTALTTGEMFIALTKQTHSKFSISHTRGMGFDTSLWTITFNSRVFTGPEMEEVIQKAYEALVPQE